MKRNFLTLAILINLITALTAQWQRQYPLPKLEEVLDIVVRNDGYGFATGSDDLVLRFNNGTKEWQPLPDSEFGWSLFAVDYLQGSDGEYVAAGGTGLIVSENGGYNWTKIQDAPAGIMKVKILDEDLIIVIAGNGVHRWNGVFWTSLNAPPTANVIGGQILDADHIWAYTGGSDPRIYYTSNGGQNWGNNDQIDRPDGIVFYDELYGVAFDNRIVYQSLNGGANWTQVSSNAIHNSISDVTFGETANILMAAALNGDPAYSVDSGQTWDVIDMDLLIGRNYSIANIGDEFWVGNDLSSIGYTPDSGGGWSERSGPRREPVHDIHFLDRDIGFAVGFDGLLLRTENGGSNWDNVNFETNRNYWSVHGTAANNLWIGANQRIYHSSDTGKTWMTKASFLGGGINDILAVSTSRILAVTSAGVLLRSNDAGASFDTVYMATTQLRSIARIDAQRYMATGFNGIILRSNDQGETWTPLTAPEPGLQYEQAFFLDTEGWLVTSSFKHTMWHTTNAGDNWTPITLPIDRFWDGVYFITPDTGVVVSNSATEGRAYITYNGGQQWQSSYVTDFQLLGVTGVPNPNGTAWIFGEGADIEILPYCTELPAIANLQGDQSPCEGDTVTFTMTSANVGQFDWHFPSGWSIIGNSNNDTIRLRAGNVAGNVSVTGVNACGFTNALQLPLTPTTAPLLGTVTGPNSPCQDEPVTYTVNAIGIDFFDWTMPGPDWLILSPESSHEIQVIPGLSIGPIQVVGGNVCGIVNSTPFLVTPRPFPVANSIEGIDAICQGDTGTFKLLGEHFNDVIWSVSGDWQILVQPTVDEIMVRFNSSGSGEITAIARNDCGNANPLDFAVTVHAVPSIAISNVANTLTATFNGTASAIQWYLDGDAIAGATNAVYEATASGNYTVAVTFDNGCTGSSPVLNVVIVSVDPTRDDLSIQLMPVPAKDVITVKGLNSETSYEIIDLHGRVCMKGNVFNAPLTVSSLPDGLYAMKLQLPDKIVVKQLIIL